MTDLIALYSRDQQRRGLSATTIDKRRRCLELFAREAGLGADREQIEQWLDGRGLTAKSRSVWLSHLGCYFQWAKDHHYVQVDPTVKIRSPKIPRRLPRPMPDQDLEKALAHADAKMRCWLLLEAYMGLRCMEVAALEREDVLDEGLLRIRGKGGRERLLPLNPQVSEALGLYGMPERGALFRNRFGLKVSAGDVSHAIGDFLRGLGITSTAHSLRHWCATKLMASTHDLRVVQEALGHASPETTAIYAGWDREVMRTGMSGLRVGG